VKAAGAGFVMSFLTPNPSARGIAVFLLVAGAMTAAGIWGIAREARNIPGAGDCVTRSGSVAACDSPRALARVAKTVDDESPDFTGSISMPDCPAETDAVSRVNWETSPEYPVAGGDTTVTYCLVLINGDKREAPGQGGGIARIGDCLRAYTLGDHLIETGCKQVGAEDKIIDRVRTSAECPDAEYYATLHDVPNSVLCLAPARARVAYERRMRACRRDHRRHEREVPHRDKVRAQDVVDDALFEAACSLSRSLEPARRPRGEEVRLEV
jgi:hypothetical protein